MEFTYDWGDFRGGISDLANLGAQGTFQDGKMVDVASEAPFLKLSAIPVNKFTTDTKTNGFVNSGSAGISGIFSFTQDGKIYDSDGGTPGTPIYTLTGAVSSKNIFFVVPRKEGVNVYFYVFTEGKIHQANSDFSTVTENYKTFSGQPTSFFQYADKIFFTTSQGLIYSLDTLGNLATEHTFRDGEIPVAITFFQDSFRVYSNDQVDGYLSIFDVSDLTAPTYRTVWERLRVSGATSAGSFDYVVADNDVYVASGTQRQLVLSSNEGSGAVRNFNGFAHSRLADPYFVSTGGSRNGIYKYAESWAGMPKALTRIFDNSTYDVYAVMCTNTLVWISYRDSAGAYRVATIDVTVPPAYAEEGEITSLITDFGNKYVKKTIKKIEISYDCDNSDPQFPHGGEIELYARTKRSATWTKIADTGVKTDVGTLLVTSPTIDGIRDFHSIEFRIVLKRGSSSLSPLLKGILITADGFPN